jgi:predicted amidohydrolase YtcJ
MMTDKLLFNAQIITMDKANPQAEAMVIGINGKIKAIGNFIPLKNTFPNAESIDLHN